MTAKSKRNSKAAIALMLAMTLAAGSLAGCGKKDESSSSTSTSASTSASESSSKEEASSTPDSSTDESSSTTPDDPKPADVKKDLSYDDYTLVWEDNFDGDKLNRDDWNVELHDPGWVNAELQAYVDSEENIYVKDGVLCLNPVKNGDNYTSGRVNTQGKHDFKYGLFEAVAKVPKGMGYLPAFWMMPTDENLYGQWPKCGEIDIMEVMGQSTNKLHGTIHFGEPHAQSQGTYDITEGKDFSDEFHTFTVDWEPGKITWYIDGIKYHEEKDWFSAITGGGELTYPAPFDQPFYVILNLAIGGSWVGYPDETTSFDNNPFMIDSVKIYRKDDEYYADRESKAERPVKVITYRDPDENGNFVYNGDFAADLNSDNDWNLHLESDGSGSEAKSVDGECVITQSAAGSVAYSVQLLQGHVPLLKGVEYTFSFDARADEARKIMVDIEGPDKSWIRYLKDTEIDLTTEMQTFTYVFTMTEDTDANTCVEFNLGNYGSTATVYIDNVSLLATGGEAIVGPAAKTVRADGNYVYNGAFQEGTKRLGSWEFSDDYKRFISVTNENNDRRLKIEASDIISAENPVVVKQTGLPLKEGKYSLTFNAGKSDDADAKAFTIKVGGFTYDVELTDDKDKAYSASFEFKKDDAAEIILEFAAPGTYYVDNIMVCEDALVKNGKFNAGMSGFTQYTYDTAKCDYTVDSLSEDNAFAITINDTGTEDWHVQLFQDGVNLEKGKKYKLTFKAKSNLKRNIKAVLQHNGSSDDNWNPYFEHMVCALTDEYQTFSAEFEMEADSDPVARLDFALGMVDDRIQEQHSIFIDDIVLEEV